MVILYLLMSDINHYIVNVNNCYQDVKKLKGFHVKKVLNRSLQS